MCLCVCVFLFCSYNDLSPEMFSLSNSGTIMIASAKEEEITDFKHLSFKRTFSEKISRKTGNTIDNKI